jgi:beta-phosphoglucomutase
MNMKDLQAAIFDMDGTMVDNADVHQRTWHMFCERYGLEPARIADAFGRTNREYLEMLFGLQITDEEVDRYRVEKESLYQEVYAPDIKPLPGLHDLLDELGAKGVRLAIGSSAPRMNIDFVLEKLRLKGRFEAIVCEEMVNKGKPEPDIFLKAARLLDVPAENCIVFEDSYWGIEAARRAGMKNVAILTNKSKEELAISDFQAVDFSMINLDVLRRLL